MTGALAANSVFKAKQQSKKKKNNNNNNNCHKNKQTKLRFNLNGAWAASEDHLSLGHRSIKSQ